MTNTVAALAAQREMTVDRFRSLTGDLLDSHEDWEEVEGHFLDMVEMGFPAPSSD